MVAAEEDLTRLLEAEQGFAARLEDVRAQTRTLVDSARRDAETMARNSELSSAEALRRLAAEVEAQLAMDLVQMETQAEARIERYSTTDDASVTTLADTALRTLLAGEAS
jgi:HPt (histidine-containing phosphotransfer) domain-containing protein